MASKSTKCLQKQPHSCFKLLSLFLCLQLDGKGCGLISHERTAHKQGAPSGQGKTSKTDCFQENDTNEANEVFEACLKRTNLIESVLLFRGSDISRCPPFITCLTTPGRDQAQDTAV